MESRFKCMDQYYEDQVIALVEEHESRMAFERRQRHERNQQLWKLFRWCLSLFILTAAVFIAHGLNKQAHADQSAKAIEIAHAELGNGEIGKNNSGEHVRKYNRSLEASWCAGFVSWVLNEAGVTNYYSRSAKQIYNQFPKVSEPKPGDLIVFWREDPNSWKGHIGIVTNVTPNTVIVIEGNKGDYPAKVRKYAYTRGSIPQFLGFVRPKDAS